MRVRVLSLFLSVAVLLPTMGNSQVFSRPTPDPVVTAQNAGWQILGEPIFFAGHFYYPAGPVVFFDGNVMVRTGHYEGIPLYADTTMTPYSVALVPIGGNLMRPYERRREGELAGTVGSRVPSFPVERDPDVITVPQYALAAEDRLRALIAAGTAGAAVGAPPAPYAPARIESIPPPATNEGVWIEYNGARWYLSGAAAAYDPQRHVPVGTYRGFPVYQEQGNAQTIFVSVIQDGPVAPYRRR